MSFVDRVGGVLVRPRATLAHVAATGEGGLPDVAVLLGLRVLAGETPQLARALLALPSLGVAMALRGVMSAFLAIVPDVLGILIGAVVMALLGGGQRKGRELDVAVYAWVPYLAVTVGVSLVDNLIGRIPGAVEQAALIAAMVWAAAVWAIGLYELKRSGDLAAEKR